MPNTIEATPAQKEAREMFEHAKEFGAFGTDVQKKSVAKKACLMALNYAIREARHIVTVYDLQYEPTYLQEMKEELIKM